ncbi:MAG: hypothetical protein QXQ20_08155 [Candidatus Nezhaarchaeales archaeon]
MGEKPTAAFVLSLVGGIIILINGIIVLVGAGIAASIATMVPGMGPAISGLVIAFASFILVMGILVIVGAVMINSGAPNKVRVGSILVIVFSVISLLGGGGFIVGFVLALVGGILGLTWKPATPPPPT